MRYIDTGQRVPEQALGSWLKQNVFENPSISALRWQTGFFGKDSLAYFRPALKLAQSGNTTTRLLVGSNDGMTSRSDAEALLKATGQPRTNLHVGIVSFGNAFFHPKTIHIEREDGSSAAYVGSANLTRSGLSKHVEAGILLDTRDGDDASILTEIATSVDWWFAAPRPGLSVVSDSCDLDTLVSSGFLDVTPPPARGKEGESGPSTATKLSTLIDLPRKAILPPPSPPVAAATWSKKLTRSDAQRKAAGNQRGSIALVQAGHAINAQSYFRHILFKNALWSAEKTRTGEIRQMANIPFRVTILGEEVGLIKLVVSYAPNRESSQANYTSLLHLGSLTDYFRQYDMTGVWLRISLTKAGKFQLYIGA